jgi:hypothetical protein
MENSVFNFENLVLVFAVLSIFIVAILLIRKRQLHDHTGYYGYPGENRYLLRIKGPDGLLDYEIKTAVTKQKAIQKYRMKYKDYSSTINARKL